MRRDLLIAFGIACATAAAFFGLGANDFVHFDDPDYLTENEHVSGGLTLGGLAWALTAFHAGNWHPLTWLSHMLDVELFGMDPGAHHRVSLLLHVINALGLFALLRWTTLTRWRSAMVAALFALHPMHVESVAWASERKDVLSTALWLATTALWIRFVRSGRSLDRNLAAGSYALGLAAKPMLVTLPFALLLLDVWPLRRLHPAGGRPGDEPGLPLARLLREKLPLLVLAAASCVVTIAAQQAGGAVRPLESLTLATRAATATVAWATYALAALWPHELAVFYPYPGSWSSGRILLSALALLSATGLAGASVRDRPYLAVGWLWFLGTLVPVIGLVQIGNQWLADRYTYVPYIGLFIAIVWGAADLARRLPDTRTARASIAVAALVLLAALGSATQLQVRYWRDTRTLFERALEVTSDNFVAHSVLGTEWARRGRLDRAEEHWFEAIRLRPDYDAARLNLVKGLAIQGRLAETIPHLRKLVQLRPDDPWSYFNLARALDDTGSAAEAIGWYRRGLALEPGAGDMWERLSGVEGRVGQTDASRESARRARDLRAP